MTVSQISILCIPMDAAEIFIRFSFLIFMTSHLAALWVHMKHSSFQWVGSLTAGRPTEMMSAFTTLNKAGHLKWPFPDKSPMPWK